MALVFSEIELTAGEVSSGKFIVGGSPENGDHLRGWTKTEEFLFKHPRETITVSVKVYQDGEGSTFPANPFEVAHIYEKIKRFKDRGKDWLNSIPAHIKTYSFKITPESIGFGR